MTGNVGFLLNHLDVRGSWERCGELTTDEREKRDSRSEEDDPELEVERDDALSRRLVVFSEICSREGSFSRSPLSRSMVTLSGGWRAGEGGGGGGLLQR